MEFVEFRGPGFTLQSPSTWRVFQTPRFQALWQAPTTTEGELPANFAVMIRSVSNFPGLDAFVEKLLDEQADNYADYEITSDKTVDANGKPARYITTTWQNTDAGITIQQETLYLANEDDVWHVIATYNRTTLDETIALLRQMLSSFEIG